MILVSASLGTFFGKCTGKAGAAGLLLLAVLATPGLFITGSTSVLLVDICIGLTEELAGLSMVELLSSAKILKVFVISPNFKLMLGPLQEVILFLREWMIASISLSWIS